MNPADLENITLILHDNILSVSGGRPGIRDIGLIRSALFRAFHGTADGVEFYGDIFKKAGALTQGLCLNHGFEDGNKRTGLAVGMLFLFRNGYYVPKQDPIIATDFVLRIVEKDRTKRLSVEEISGWFKSRSIARGSEHDEAYLTQVDLLVNENNIYG